MRSSVARPAAAPAARRPRRSSPRRAAGRGRRSAGTGPSAAPSGHVAAWWRYSAAPWSISHSSPCQINMLGLRGVRSTLAVSASSQTTSAASSSVTPTGAAGEKGSAPGRKSSARVAAAAGLHELLDLGVRLGRRQQRIDVDEHDLRDAQAERAGDLADDHLGDQRLQALPGAAELDDVQPVVVGLDEAGHRAALAQRRDVARGAHGAQRGGGRVGHRARTLTMSAATVLRTRVVRGRQHGPDGGPGHVRRAARRRRPVRVAALPRWRLGPGPAAVHRRRDRGDQRGPAQRRRPHLGRAAADPARLRARARLGDARRALVAGAAGDPVARARLGRPGDAGSASSRRSC